MNSTQIWLTVAFMIIFPTLFVAACTESHAAGADTPWIEIHGLSKHSKSTYNDGQEREFNEINIGAGVMFPVTEHVELGFGQFKNSYNINTQYAGFDWHTTSRAPVRYGVSVAIMTGYENTPTPSNIMVLPNLTIGNGNVRLKIGVLPGPTSLVTLTAGFRF